MSDSYEQIVKEMESMEKMKKEGDEWWRRKENYNPHDFPQWFKDKLAREKQFEENKSKKSE